MTVDKSEVLSPGLKSCIPTWKVTGHWPADDDPERGTGGPPPCRAAESAVRGRTITLAAAVNRAAIDQAIPPAEFTVSGILETGGPEDSQVIAPLALVQRWAGLEGKVRRIEISALTKPEDAFAHSDVSRLSGTEFDRWYCTPYVELDCLSDPAGDSGGAGASRSIMWRRPKAES